MNNRTSNHGQDESISSECKRVFENDPEFGQWLKAYIKNYPSTYIRCGWGLEYWLVPLSNMAEASEAIAGTRPNEFCSLCYKPESSNDYFSVLVIGAQPSPLVAKLRSLLANGSSVLLSLGLSLSDFKFKWGIKTCPNCFSKHLSPFTIESDDELPHHYCSGCNTIWPPRKP